ncbi:15786_t:CDS:1, partial [Racocetra fulgida]
IQHFHYGSELPKIFASSTRLERSQNGELWLGETTFLVDSYNIIGSTTVWFQDTPEPTEYYQFYVKEILYSYEGRWKIRDIKLQHRHPIEYTQIPASAPQD